MFPSPGSSPRARGTRWYRAQRLGPARFIPAGAGNTRTRLTTPTRWPVHPRGRGEHARACRLTSDLGGSSPRARGTRIHAPWSSLPGRFIPAGAGNTGIYCGRATAAPVHPRGRGEHCLAKPCHACRAGSSPRARGTPRRRRGPDLWRRFIPAGAGNTLSWRSSWPRGPVHPRGRGEHQCRSRRPQGRRGSSPRARGTLESRR